MSTRTPRAQQRRRGRRRRGKPSRSGHVSSAGSGARDKMHDNTHLGNLLLGRGVDYLQPLAVARDPLVVDEEAGGEADARNCESGHDVLGVWCRRCCWTLNVTTRRTRAQRQLLYYPSGRQCPPAANASVLVYLHRGADTRQASGAVGAEWTPSLPPFSLGAANPANEC